MKKYYAISRHDCPICIGKRIITTSLWRKFITFMEKWERRYPEKYCQPGIGQFDKKVSIQSSWWAKQGYPDGWTTWPSKDQKCYNCHGRGYIEENVDFNEALVSTLNLKLSA